MQSKQVKFFGNILSVGALAFVLLAFGLNANDPEPPAAPPPNLIYKDGFEPPTGLIISSNVTEAIHRTRSQLITFTFDEDVSGFEALDITLTGVLAGAFAPVSDSVYTLRVTSLGGTVTVGVPFAAAITLSDGSSTGAASFSNFYQDTPQINLPDGVSLRLVRIPAGTFLMGSADDELSRNANEAQHQVTLSRDYYVGETEITQEQWLAVMGTFPNAQPEGSNDDLPLERVSWDDISDPSSGFLKALNDHIATTVQPFEVMLPTESQWEYAARAGTNTRFSFGDGFAADENCATGGGREDHMWYCGNSGDATQLVAQKLTNPWGLYDMHGNVGEWVADFLDSYPTGPVIDPTGPDTGIERVVRGGASSLEAEAARSASRAGTIPGDRLERNGFRIAASRPAALGISSNRADPHLETTQQISFTLEGGGFASFDGDQIDVTGAIKGDFGPFNPPSPIFYILQLQNTEGGTVTVDVPGGSAIPFPPYTTSAPATFSNFFITTVTIQLPDVDNQEVTMDFVLIPPGTFTQGAPDGETTNIAEKPQFEVTISEEFYISRTEVTQNQWEAVKSLTNDAVFPSVQDPVGGSKPVHNLSYVDITTGATTADSGFLQILAGPLGDQGFRDWTARLPTESEWEYAARAGTTTRFSFGDGFSTDDNCALGGGREDHMWYCGNAGGSVQDVGLKLPNPWGLYDMHGNAAEWTDTPFYFYPDPSGPTSLDNVVRGGHYTQARSCRSASRTSFTRTLRATAAGFRVVLVRD